MKRLRIVLWVLLVAVVAGSVIWLLLRPIMAPLNYYDEGLVLVNAENVLRGDVPYRDFWTLYAPGYYYMLAAVLRFFGMSVFVARVFDVLQRAVLVLAVYGVARRFVSRPAALLPLALVALWVGSTTFYSYPVFPALTYTLLACLGLFRYFDLGRRRWPALAGAGVGLALIVRHDMGAYALLGLGLGLLVHEAGGRRAWRSLLLYAVGAAAVAAPFYLYLALAGSPRAMWNDLVVFPATSFRAYRDLPKPALLSILKAANPEAREDWLRFYLPLLAYALAGVALLASHLRRRAKGLPLLAGDAPLVALAATGLLLFNQALGRYEALHVLPSQVLALLVAVALLARLPGPAWARLALPALLLAVTWPAYVGHYAAAYEQVRGYRPGGSYSSLAHSGGVPLAPAEQETVEYIRQHTAEEEAIFVGNRRHDLIVVNDLGFYFLAGRRSPSVYQELHPGVATTLPVQQEIVESLEAAQVEYVVLVEVWEPREPNRSAESSGVTHLDDYIRANYQQCFQRGSYRVYRRVG